MPVRPQALPRVRRALLAGVVVATSFGATAPAEASSAEVRRPAASAESRHATVVLVHGGGWVATGEAAMATVRSTARRFNRDGYRTVSLDYRAGSKGIDDVKRGYDQEAERRPGESRCVYGESAGGHWALLLAASRPAIDCVIAVAAPTNLTSGLSDFLNERVAAVFGLLGVAYSPVTYADKITASVLLAYGADDEQVPVSQGAQLERELASAKLRVLPAGRRKWMHGTASKEAISDLKRLETRWIERTLDLG